MTGVSAPALPPNPSNVCDSLINERGVKNDESIRNELKHDARLRVIVYIYIYTARVSM